LLSTPNFFAFVTLTPEKEDSSVPAVAEIRLEQFMYGIRTVGYADYGASNQYSI
jgi:hypothetical protein